MAASAVQLSGFGAFRPIGGNAFRAFVWMAALLVAGAGCGSDPAARDRMQESGAGSSASGGAAGSGSAARAGAPGQTPAVDCSQVQVGLRRLWRLTPEQYDNTVRDLLGVEGTWGEGFPTDAVVGGFRNNADALQVSPLLADKLRDAAEDIAARTDVSRLDNCTASGGGEGCLITIMARVGERAFRRSVTTDELMPYLELAHTAGTFEGSVRLMLTAMLQSPYFLYRFELGTRESGNRYALNDFEIANELSYLLWQTMPDFALFTAAHSGELHTAEQIRAQVARMLADPRSKEAVRAFVRQWLGLDAIATVPKDPMRFPELDSALREELSGEVDRFVDHVMFELDGSPAALLTTPVTFLNQALADFYGVALSGANEGGIAMTELGAQQRRGILTLGGTMLAHARSNDSSPVHRGKLIRERFLCQPLLPPPPGIVVQPPPLDPTKTTRERYAAHSQNEPCKTCHRLMDPIGLGFEHFDGIGRFRADDNGHAIDATGEIFDSPSSDGRFDGTNGLIEKLAGSEDVRSCYARQWLRFAYGMSEDQDGACVSQRVQDAYANSDGSLGALLAILTEGDQLRYRIAAPDAGTAPPVAPDPRSDAGSSGEAADAGATHDMLSDALQLKQTVNNDWGAGYCQTYEVTNVSTAPVTWSVPLEISGTLNQHWQSEVSGDSGNVVFTGAEYNATLEPSASTQFGFCAMR